MDGRKSRRRIRDVKLKLTELTLMQFPPQHTALVTTPRTIGGQLKNRFGIHARTNRIFMRCSAMLLLSTYLSTSAGCATYHRAWHRDRFCFTRCQNDLGSAWGGGRYGDTSAYCICVTGRDGHVGDEGVATALTPMAVKDAVGMPRPMFAWHLSAAMRACRDLTTLVCGLLP